MNIIDKINIREFISRFVTVRFASGDELSCNCPFHADEHASFSINQRTGLWKCHAASCDASAGGNLTQLVYQVYAKEKGFTSLREAYQWICQDQGIEYSAKDSPELSEETVQDHHQALLINTEVLKVLESKYHYSQETIERFKLGFAEGRIIIPIYDERGNIVNLRKKPIHSGHCIGIEFHNQMRLFPIQNLANEEIYLMEGEKDCMLACQYGLNALTVTSGAGSFQQDWIPAFKDKKVRIVYDIDEAGIRGAQRIKEFLLNVTAELKIINLPIFEPPNADFADYMGEASIEEFQKLVDSTKPEDKQKHRPTQVPNYIHNIELAHASNAQYYYQRVRLSVVVSGKDMQPYLPPRLIEVKCPMGQKICTRCGMAQYGGNYEIILDHLSENILQWVDCTIEHHTTLIKHQLEIPMLCRVWKYKILKAQNVEEITIIPEINYTSVNSEYVVRTAYVIGESIRTNHNYRLEAVTVPHPKTQYATQLVYHIAENRTAIDEFQMTEQVRRRLVMFQVIQIEGTLHEKV